MEKDKIIENSASKEIYCEDCGCIIEPQSTVLKTVNGGYLCSRCHYNYFICEQCGLYFRSEDFFSGPNDSICCSEECLNKYDPWDFSRKLSYDAKPPVHFLGSTKEDELYLGVEVEVTGEEEDKDGEGKEYEDNCIYKIFNVAANEVFCKHDGSLRGGFEFVTHPATLDYHKNTLKYEELLKICDSWGFSGFSERAGLHIHINRKFFGEPIMSDYAALKLEILFERFWTRMLLFSNRSEEKATRWAKNRDMFCTTQNIDEYSPEDTYLRELYFYMKLDRYSAINTTNRTTIEIRLFGGTSDLKEIFAKIEMVDYLSRYVKDTPMKEIITTSWEDIFKNAITNKNYENLVNRLVFLGLLKERREECA